MLFPRRFYTMPRLRHSRGRADAPRRPRSGRCPEMCRFVWDHETSSVRSEIFVETPRYRTCHLAPSGATSSGEPGAMWTVPADDFAPDGAWNAFCATILQRCRAYGARGGVQMP